MPRSNSTPSKPKKTTGIKVPKLTKAEMDAAIEKFKIKHPSSQLESYEFPLISPRWGGVNFEERVIPYMVAFEDHLDTIFALQGCDAVCEFLWSVMGLDP